MPVAIDVPLALADVLCCLGLGLAVAALYDGVLFLFGRRVALPLDIAAFVLAGILACSYAASRSYAGVVRWYHLAGMAAGAAAYQNVLAPATFRLRRLILWVLGLPLRLLVRIAAPPARRLKGWIQAERSRRIEKKRLKARQKRIKQLQSTAKVLYNSN